MLPTVIYTYMPTFDGSYMIKGVMIKDGEFPYRFSIPLDFKKLIEHGNKRIELLIKKEVKNYFSNEEISMFEL